MKKLLLIALLSSLFVSCGESEEDKLARKMIEKIEIQKEAKRVEDSIEHVRASEKLQKASDEMMKALDAMEQ